MKRRRVLIINGSCLKVNSSATLCHIAYIQGFIDCGWEVVVVSKNAKNQIIDNSIVLPKEAKYYEYDGSFLVAHSGQTIKTTVLNTKAEKTSEEGSIIPVSAFLARGLDVILRKF